MTETGNFPADRVLLLLNFRFRHPRVRRLRNAVIACCGLHEFRPSISLLGRRKGFRCTGSAVWFFCVEPFVRLGAVCILHPSCGVRYGETVAFSRICKLPPPAAIRMFPEEGPGLSDRPCMCGAASEPYDVPVSVWLGRGLVQRSASSAAAREPGCSATDFGCGKRIIEISFVSLYLQVFASDPRRSRTPFGLHRGGEYLRKFDELRQIGRAHV